MAEIRCVTCGKMTMYAPNGNSLPGELLQMFCFQKGAVIVQKNGNIKDNSHVIQPDDKYLAEAVSAIKKLIAANPDFPCKARPFFNEACMDDGTYRYMPYDELLAVLENLYRAVREQEFKLPNPAGLVGMEAPLPDKAGTDMSEITEIRLDTEDLKYDLKIRKNNDSASFVIYGDGNRMFYTFKPSLEALAELLDKVKAITADEKFSDKRHDVTFASGETKYADPVKLESLLDDFISKLSEDTENVEFIDQSAMTNLAGAVSYKPSPLENLMGIGGIMKPDISNNPPQERPTVYLNDGTWDCVCGAKGLTTKFCINCGAKKPEMWKCSSCGTENYGRICEKCGTVSELSPDKVPVLVRNGKVLEENAGNEAAEKRGVLHDDGTWDCACGSKGITSRFCCECGAVKPDQWKCGCVSYNSGKFCTNCGKPKE